MRQLLNLLRLLDHVKRQNVLIRFIHVGLQLYRQLKEFVGISLERGLPPQVGFLGQFSGHPRLGLVRVTRCWDGSASTGRSGVWSLGLRLAGNCKQQTEGKYPGYSWELHKCPRKRAVELPARFLKYDTFA